ncbi:MAG: hypothetical protein J6U81_07670, partial [Bacteroidales bacterium]|nr:hypothetical protein [Bacteroidales bacterium]
MKSKISPFRMPFFLMLLCLCSCSPIKVNKMTCNYEENALAASDAPLRFSWQLSSNKQACMQSAYQLEVYDSRNNRVWETSPVQSNQSQLVLYDGPALQAAQKYYWR